MDRWINDSFFSVYGKIALYYDWQKELWSISLSDLQVPGGTLKK
jgi:hypothetical protein